MRNQVAVLLFFTHSIRAQEVRAFESVVQTYRLDSSDYKPHCKSEENRELNKHGGGDAGAPIK